MAGLFIHNILTTDSVFVANILVIITIVSCLNPCIQRVFLPLHLGPNHPEFVVFTKIIIIWGFERVSNAAERFREISLCILNDVIQSTRVIKDHRMSENTYQNMSNLSVNTVLADGLAPAGAKVHAHRMVNIFGYVTDTCRVNIMNTSVTEISTVWYIEIHLQSLAGNDGYGHYNYPLSKNIHKTFIALVWPPTMPLTLMCLSWRCYGR